MGAPGLHKFHLACPLDPVRKRSGHLCQVVFSSCSSSPAPPGDCKTHPSPPFLSFSSTTITCLHGQPRSLSSTLLSFSKMTLFFLLYYPFPKVHPLHNEGVIPRKHGSAKLLEGFAELCGTCPLPSALPSTHSVPLCPFPSHGAPACATSGPLHELFLSRNALPLTSVPLAPSCLCLRVNALFSKNP